MVLFEKPVTGYTVSLHLAGKIWSVHAAWQVVCMAVLKCSREFARCSGSSLATAPLTYFMVTWVHGNETTCTSTRLSDSKTSRYIEELHSGCARPDRVIVKLCIYRFTEFCIWVHWVLEFLSKGKATGMYNNVNFVIICIHALPL